MIQLFMRSLQNQYYYSKLYYIVLDGLLVSSNSVGISNSKDTILKGEFAVQYSLS